MMCLHVFEHFQKMSQKCEQFSYGPFFRDLLGFGVLNGPLTSLKHPSEGYNVAEASPDSYFATIYGNRPSRRVRPVAVVVLCPFVRPSRRPSRRRRPSYVRLSRCANIFI